MEPKLVKVDRNQNKILIIVGLLVISLFIGTSYSLLSSNDTIEDAIVFKTGDLNLKLTGDSNLTLDKEYPKSDEEGKENKAIKLTFTNTGTIDICNYEVNLISDSESNLDQKYLKYIISENNEESYQEVKNLDDTNIVYIGNKLKVGKSKTIYIKVWIDENAKDAGLSKTYSGSFEVELYQGGCVEYGIDTIENTLGKKGGVIGVTNDGTLATTKSNNIREYRYSGLDVNNYVTFNDEEWRIIGVFEDEYGAEHLKIARNEILKRDMLPVTYVVNGTEYKIQYPSGDVAYWNKKISGTNNNDWATAGLQYWLNAGSDVETKSPKDGYMSYLSQSAKAMIEDAKYYLGMVTFQYVNATNFGIIDTPKEAYMNERTVTGCVDNKGPIENEGENLKFENTQNCRVWANNFATWSGNIALLYSSDYGYSSDSKYWNTKLDNPTFNGTASDSSWLQKGANHESTEWLLSATTYFSLRVARWSIDGFIGSYDVDDDIDLNTIRPCLYLKSNVKIISGDGTRDNAYKVSFVPDNNS